MAKTKQMVEICVTRDVDYLYNRNFEKRKSERGACLCGFRYVQQTVHYYGFPTAWHNNNWLYKIVKNLTTQINNVSKRNFFEIFNYLAKRWEKYTTEANWNYESKKKPRKVLPTGHRIVLDQRCTALCLVLSRATRFLRFRNETMKLCQSVSKRAE